MDFVELRNGVKVPALGFGTYKIKSDEEIEETILTALQVGYRHFDTAAIYGNEEGIGKAIKKSGIKREEIFLTSKLWNTEHGYDKTLRAFQETLKNLGTDYLDLYLIHWPKDLNVETWKAFEKLYKEGLVKSIGVSNFMIDHLDEIKENAEIMPMVNQIEFHPQLIQKDLNEYCRDNRIQLEAWSPLMRGRIFSFHILQELSEKYNRTISQIVLRWDIQMGFITIPKSVTKERIKENFNIFDFQLEKEDVKKIAMLNVDKRIGPDPYNLPF